MVRRVRILTTVSFGAFMAFGAIAFPVTAQRPTDMTQGALERFILDRADTAEGGGGLVQFVFDGVLMALVSDSAFGRMRIIAPISPDSLVTDDQRRLMMDANFHSALDARYATSQGILYAAFIHPRPSLREEELLSAVEQVASLVKTFGSTYSSGVLEYGTPQKNRMP